jgi:hypothetical protein
LPGRWRDLPERFGDHQAVKCCYYRWIGRGALDKFLEALSTETDLEWLMSDSTIARAHLHAAGAWIAQINIWRAGNKVRRMTANSRRYEPACQPVLHGHRLAVA